MKAIRNLALISAACLAFSGTVLVLPAWPDAAAEEPAVRENACGEQVSWKLEDGTLTVFGMGEMYDYIYPPHYVTTVKETLCDFAFCWCSTAQEITLPSTLKTIHDSAFFNCFDLKQINLPEGLNTIGTVPSATVNL